jgi:hypothetical protein
MKGKQSKRTFADQQTNKNDVSFGPLFLSLSLSLSLGMGNNTFYV